ncbi:MAG TPA: hypothetical protein VK994_08240 [Bacteroidales bacterium]|nr:hypothetical protein [Bacteroidales bacterium]
MPFAACKKDDSGSSPVIEIYTPSSNAAFLVTDTIRVSGKAMHDRELGTVSFVIRNNMNVAVSVPRYFFPNANEFNFDFNYLINAPGLETGNYNLHISASDGMVSSSEYLPLQLKGVDRYFQQTLALCRPSILKTYVYAISDDWQAHSIMSLDYGFIDSEITSSQRKLKLIKPQPSSLLVYDLDDLVEDQWLAASPPYPLFNDIYTTDDLTYVATENGDVKGVNQYGQVQFVTSQSMDTIPQLLHSHDNLLISFNKRRSGADRLIMQYYRTSGVLRMFANVNFDIIRIFSADEDLCILFTEENHFCSLYTYHVEDNYIELLAVMPAGEIRDAVKINANEYLIAHSEGIYRYNYVTGYISFWQPDKDIDHMAYDYTRSLLYCSEGNVIRVFNVNDASLVKEISLPYPVYALHIQYNI